MVAPRPVGWERGLPRRWNRVVRKREETRAPSTHPRTPPPNQRTHARTRPHPINKDSHHLPSCPLLPYPFHATNTTTTTNNNNNNNNMIGSQRTHATRHNPPSTHTHTCMNPNAFRELSRESRESA